MSNIPCNVLQSLSVLLHVYSRTISLYHCKNDKHMTGSGRSPKNLQHTKRQSLDPLSHFLDPPLLLDSHYVDWEIFVDDLSQ